MKKKTYSFDEAYQASLRYFEGDELAAKVWVSKYALKDSAGNIYEKSPADMHKRLAKEIHRIESKYKNPLSEQELFDLFDKFRILRIVLLITNIVHSKAKITITEFEYIISFEM